MVAPAGAEAGSAHEVAHERELMREATTMVLYLTIVLLAELAVLPTGGTGDGFDGLSGGELLAVIWGTTIGLAVAHFFAFRLAVRAFGAGGAGREDAESALAQLTGAAVVAVIASVPILVMPDDLEQRSVHFVLALEVGIIGYLVARIAGQRRGLAAVYGLTALLLGLVIVTVKVLLEH